MVRTFLASRLPVKSGENGGLLLASIQQDDLHKFSDIADGGHRLTLVAMCPEHENDYQLRCDIAGRRYFYANLLTVRWFLLPLRAYLPT